MTNHLLSHAQSSPTLPESVSSEPVPPVSVPPEPVPPEPIPLGAVPRSAVGQEAPLRSTNPSPTSPPIPMVDLHAQQRQLRRSLEARLFSVLDHGLYLNGPEIEELEDKLGSYCGVRHAVSCSSGTDSLLIALMGLGIGSVCGEGSARDAVLVPSFTFAASAEAVVLAGAVPVFVDIERQFYLIDPSSVSEGFSIARQHGLTVRAVLAVDLFGIAADYRALRSEIGRQQAKSDSKTKIALISDMAQAFGARRANQSCAQLADIACTSFFPSKPLGGYGDSGAVLSHDTRFIERVRSIRTHGQGASRYDHVRVGATARMDSFQAAVLLEKFKTLDDERAKRTRIAQNYSDSLRDTALTLPTTPPDCVNAWAQYTLGANSSEQRNTLMQALKEQNIASTIFYPRGVSEQIPYRRYPRTRLPNTERAASEVFSIPFHPYLDAADQDRVITALRRAL